MPQSAGISICSGGPFAKCPRQIAGAGRSTFGRHDSKQKLSMRRRQIKPCAWIRARPERSGREAVELWNAAECAGVLALLHRSMLRTKQNTHSSRRPCKRLRLRGFLQSMGAVFAAPAFVMPRATSLNVQSTLTTLSDFLNQSGAEHQLRN